MLHAAETPVATNPTTSAVTRARAVAVPIALLAIGVAMVWLCWWARDLHRFTQWVAAYIWLFIGEFAMCLLALGIVLKWNSRSTAAAQWLNLGIVLVVAIALRFTLVPQRPYLSSDVYRYAWDGHVQTEGINPYAAPPDSPVLDPLRDAGRFPRAPKIYPEVNRPNLPTPYPPGAQLFFWLIAELHPLSVIACKAVAAIFDIVTIIALMLALRRARLDPARVILFAWHPLPIWEGSHSGHIEAAFMMLLALALLAWSHRRNALTGMMLALAAAVKYYPAIVVPAFLRTRNEETAARRSSAARRNPAAIIRSLVNRSNIALVVAFAVTAVSVYLPYLLTGGTGFGSLGNEFNEEGFTGSGARYFALALVHRFLPAPVSLYLLAAGGLLLLLALSWMLRAKPGVATVARGAVAIIGAYMLLSSPRYAWYYAWILPFLCFEPQVGWIYLTGASVFMYFLWYEPLVYPELPLWLGALLYGPVLAWLAWERLHRRRDLRSGSDHRVHHHATDDRQQA